MVGPAELEHRHHIDGEALEGERDIDAEIASASAATCPEQIWVLVFVADNQLSCGRDDFGLDHLVAGQTMPPLAEANPSTEHQSGNAHSHAAAMRDGAIDRVKAGIDIGVARAAPMRTSPSAPWMATSFISETSTRSPLVVEYPA